MKLSATNLFWGILLILAGGLLLAMNLGYLEWFTPEMWMYIFAGLSFLFFITYFLKGLKEWGWLFPAFILGGVAMTMFLALNGYADVTLAIPILVGVGLPFLAAFLVDRRENWWALIPAWVMAVLVAIMFISESGQDELIGALVMFAIALPFLLVFLVRREQKWALIPALVMLSIGLVILASSLIQGALGATLILWVIALPFLVIYLWRSENWWALIPAGVLASIGLAVLMVELNPFNLNATAVMNVVMYLGWALTFAVLWLRRSTQPTGWAIYPAMALAAVALAALILGSNMQVLWPVLLILAGAVVLFFSLRRQKA